MHPCIPMHPTRESDKPDLNQPKTVSDLTGGVPITPVYSQPSTPPFRSSLPTKIFLNRVNSDISACIEPGLCMPGSGRLSPGLGGWCG